MAKPESVGTRDLKTRLGGYLRRVREGRTLIVTDRGRPVAELRPIPGREDDDAVIARLQDLGIVAAAVPRPLAPLRPLAQRRARLSDALLEDRDDRL